MSTVTANHPYHTTLAPARYGVDRCARRRRAPSGVALVLVIGAGILGVFALVAATAPFGVLGAAAAFLATILAGAAILVVTFRLLDGEDAR